MHVRQMRISHRSSVVGLEAQSCVIPGHGVIVSLAPAPGHRPSRQLKQLARDISVCCLFWTVFSRTGAEKLLGLSEPAPQIPDRAFRHFWLWFDPSALGVNVDRTLNVGHLLSGQYDEFTARPRGERPRVCFLSLRPVSS